MPIICWGNLAKSADDVQKIEQAIKDYVETHDRNANAHMGEGYALGVHRIQNIMDHPYSSIYPWHIYAIDAFKITTGSLVVKGQGPYIVVQDPEDGERVRIYPEGIIIKKGKIVIQDEDEVTVVDSKGLVSTGSFVFDSDVETAQQSTTSTVWVDIPNSSVSFTLGRTARVLLIATGLLVQEGQASDDTTFVVLSVDGTELDDAVGAGGGLKVGEIMRTPFALHTVVELEAGEHTVKLRWKVSNAAVTGYVSYRRLSYLILGK